MCCCCCCGGGVALYTPPYPAPSVSITCATAGRSRKRTNGLWRIPGSFSNGLLARLLLHGALEHLVEAHVHIWLSSRGATVGSIGIVGHDKGLRYG